jgi:hypothetical protein
MRLKNRVRKIENILKNNLVNKSTIQELAESMTSEEAERIVNESLNRPKEPLYVKTKEGFVDVYKIDSQDKLARICDDYVQMRIDLYSKQQLDEFGVEKKFLPQQVVEKNNI